MRLIDDGRTVAGWLNYQALTPDNIDPYTSMGPNLLGERLWPVEVDGTRLGFSYIAPEGM